MLQLLALFAAVGFVNLLFVALQVVAFKVARFPVDQIGFGLPFLLKRRVNGVELEIGPVPTLAFVYSLAWKEASRGKRALTAVAPWLAIGCIPLVLRTRAGAQPRAFDVAPPDPRRARQRARSRAPRRALATAGSAQHVLFALFGIRPEDRAGKIIAAVSFVLWCAVSVSWLVKLLTFLSH